MVNILKLREIQKKQNTSAPENKPEPVSPEMTVPQNQKPHKSYVDEEAKQALLKNILAEIENDPLLNGGASDSKAVEKPESKPDQTPIEIVKKTEPEPEKVPEVPGNPEPEEVKANPENESFHSTTSKIQKDTCDLVTFTVDNRTFGIEIDYIQSVVKPTEITRVPNTLDFIRGVINLRGNIRPVIDLRTRFKLGATAITEKTRIVILQLEDHQFGFMVDNIANIIHIPMKDIAPPPDIIQGIDTSYVKSVVKLDNEETMLILLNLPYVFNPNDMH